MSEIAHIHSPFDAIRRIDARGEHWSGRELMPVMGYTDWRNFEDAIARARAACANAGHRPTDHVGDATKMVRIGSNAERAVADYRLTRFGAYLVAMNGDPRKAEVAAAQTYFAVKTREAETRPAVPELPNMDTPEGQLQVAEWLVDARRAVVEQAREIEAQRAELDWAVPRARYTDRFVDGAGDATTVRDFAKQLQVQEKAFREWMVDRSLIYRCRTTSDWKPRAQTGPRRHWFALRDQPEAPRHHNGQMRTTLYVTPAGKVGIVELLGKYPFDGQGMLAV